MEKKADKTIHQEFDRVKQKQQSGRGFDRYDCQKVGQEIITNVKNRFKSLFKKKIKKD